MEKNVPSTYEELTVLQQRFVDFYIKYWKAGKAAKLAGYSEDTYRQMGYENLTKPYIQAIIKERSKLFIMDEGETAIRLTKFARGSLKSFLDTTNSLVVERDNKDIDLVKKIKSKKTIIHKKDGPPIETIETEIEIEDRQSALDKLAKMMGMYKGDAKKEETNPYSSLTPEQLVEELSKLGYKIIKEDATEQHNSTDQ